MNPEKRKISYMDQLFYYMFSEEESCTIIMNLTLRVPVNKVHLKKALNVTLLRFPNFQQTPILDKEGFLYTVNNNQEADVYPYDPDPCEFGTYEVNGYMFRVMYMGKKIWISAFHALCDGKGMYTFARTLLYYYFSFGGCRIENKDGFYLTLDTPEDRSEMGDPLEIYPEVNSSAVPLFKRNEIPVFYLPEEVNPVDKCQYFRRFQFILDRQKCLERAHVAETSFDAWFNLQIAKLIHSLYDTQGRLVTEIGCVDVRRFYNSKTLQNMTWLFWVPFIEPLFKIPEKYAAMMVRDVLMKTQLQKQNFDADLYEIKRSRRENFNFPLTDLERLKMLRESLWDDPGFQSTFFTTDVGVLELGPDIDPFIEHADIFVSATADHPSFEIITFGNEITVNLVQRHFGNKLALKVLGMFRDLGVLIKYQDCGRFQSDKIHIRELKREK